MPNPILLHLAANVLHVELPAVAGPNGASHTLRFPLNAHGLAALLGILQARERGAVALRSEGAPTTADLPNIPGYTERAGEAAAGALALRQEAIARAARREAIASQRAAREASAALFSGPTRGIIEALGLDDAPEGPSNA